MSESSNRRNPAEARRRQKLDARLRLAFLEGAEKLSRDTLGRGLTHDELRRVIGRSPIAVSGR